LMNNLSSLSAAMLPQYIIMLNDVLFVLSPFTFAGFAGPIIARIPRRNPGRSPCCRLLSSPPFIKR